jgi:hypothetical protein
MARIRSVHPGLWTDEAFVSMSPHARLLLIGIWGEADDMGAFEWKPVQLKMRLMPVDNVDMSSLLTELVEADRVAPYEADGRQYGAVRNFGRYQRPKKPKSVFPMPLKWRKYAATEQPSSEPEDDESGGGSELPFNKPERVPKKEELTASQVERVPKKSRISPQMEDGGDKMEDGVEFR